MEIKEVATESDSNVVSKLQAMFRGAKTRQLHVARAKAGHKLICPFYASSSTVVEVMIQIAHINASDIVFDLGSGNGNILINVAKLTGAQCFGFDIDQTLCNTARRLSKTENILTLIDLIVADISDIDFIRNSTVAIPTVICIFLVPSCLQELSSKLQQAYDLGVRIVCYKFQLPIEFGWQPNEIIETEDVVNTNDPNARSNVYYYFKGYVNY